MKFKGLQVCHRSAVLSELERSKRATEIENQSLFTIVDPDINCYVSGKGLHSEQELGE